MFEINYNEASEGKLQPGTYEVLIESCETDYTKNGTEHKSMPLVVRNDIDQKFKNNYIWNKVWKKKDTGEYVPWVLQTIAKAVKLPHGKSYPNVESLFADFVGKPVRVTVSIRESNGYENLNVDRWEETQFPTVNHVWKKREPIGTEVQLSENDIPF